jgi:mRNA-degrading endonuclease RelE of RelBE toxin-antitoxin system
MKIFLRKSSQKYLANLDNSVRAKILIAIEKLPDQGDVKRLKGQKAHDLFRLRVGRFRVIYFWENEYLEIVSINTRGDIYK